MKATIHLEMPTYGKPYTMLLGAYPEENGPDKYLETDEQVSVQSLWVEDNQLGVRVICDGWSAVYRNKYDESIKNFPSLFLLKNRKPF